MFEDITMEKKLSRPQQPVKGIAENKNNQDATTTKILPKSPRKRDKPGPKVEQSKKIPFSSQKSQQGSRKGSTRSSHHEIGGKVAELAALDDEFDLKRSKKQNLAHLLNIHCKPRESYLDISYHHGSRAVFPHNSIRYLMSTHKHKYNKEQFLQANCQFVVRDDADYSIHMAEPDILVGWNLIEQIRVPSFEPVTCPICMEVPVAGKITRCGHIYCWPCILHYLSLTDQAWYKCPICYEAIYGKDLKSVEIVNQTCYNKGHEIAFQLMKREHGSTISVPVLEPYRTPNVLLSVCENKHTTVYSKLLLVDYDNILKIIEAEKNQLMNELKETEGTPEMCYVEHAIELLKERRVKLQARNEEFAQNNLEHGGSAICNVGKVIQTSSKCEASEAGSSKSFDLVDGAPSDESLCEGFTESNATMDGETSRTRNESVSSSGDEIPYAVTAEDLETTLTHNASPSKHYFFYQAMDGQQIYLHSLNARMLEKQYGSLEQSPSILIGSIVEIEIGSMTEELRKRLRYLQHLPITCQFQVVEIDLPESVVSNTTRTFFKDQLEKRCRLRQKKAKEEKKLEKKAEMFARKQYGCCSRSSPIRLHLDSLDHFPQCGAEEPVKFSHRNKSPCSSLGSSPSSSRRSISPTFAMSTLTVNSNTFAEKLKDTNKNGGWQKRARAESESEVNAPSRNLISDAVEAAFRHARMVKEGGEQNCGKNKKKKRKPKPVPLCSMGMVYNNS